MSGRDTFISLNAFVLSCFWLDYLNILNVVFSFLKLNDLNIMVYVLSELLFLLIEISECVGSDSNQANIHTLSTFFTLFSVCFLLLTYIIRTNTYTYHPDLFRHSI